MERMMYLLILALVVSCPAISLAEIHDSGSESVLPTRATRWSSGFRDGDHILLYPYKRGKIAGYGLDSWTDWRISGGRVELTHYNMNSELGHDYPDRTTPLWNIGRIRKMEVHQGKRVTVYTHRRLLQMSRARRSPVKIHDGAKTGDA